MNGRPHLVARVPNDGARRLVWWWLEPQSGGERILRRAELRRTAKVDDILLARLLAGEIVPGGELAYRIRQATTGAVRVSDWRVRPAGGWGDRPGERADRIAA